MFTIPDKYSNEVCGECHNMTPEKYHSCTTPCSHLVSWAGNKARQHVAEVAAKSVWRLRRHQRRRK